MYSSTMLEQAGFVSTRQQLLRNTTLLSIFRAGYCSLILGMKFQVVLQYIFLLHFHHLLTKKGLWHHPAYLKNSPSLPF